MVTRLLLPGVRLWQCLQGYPEQEEQRAAEDKGFEPVHKTSLQVKYCKG